MVTIKDIAQIANVSVSTVSKVLNGKGRVSEKKRREILKIARDLKYTPNYYARRMSSRIRVHTIGLIVPDITNPFFAKLARGVQRVCGEDVLVILMDSFRDLEREEKLIRKLRFFGVDGIIIGNSRVSDDLVKEVSQFLPVVVFDKNYEYKNVVSIVLDNFHGAYIATKHLIDKGYRNIVHIGGTHELYVSLQREEGYKAAMKDHGLSPRVYPTGYDELKGYKMMKRILKAENVDGVFCMNDLVAIGAIRAIKERGLKIPDHIGVVGFDNDEELCETVSPSLSSVHQPVEEMGEAAAKSLVDMISSRIRVRKYVFSPRLVVRESSSGKKG